MRIEWLKNILHYLIVYLRGDTAYLQHCQRIEMKMQIRQDKAPLIYIILLNWNSWVDTIECLESLFRNDYPNYRVVVCDNNSMDDSMLYIKAWAKGNLDVFVDYDNPIRFLFLLSPNQFLMPNMTG